MARAMISLRLDQELLDAIDRAAEVEERSRNWVIADTLRSRFQVVEIQRDPEFQREVDQRIQQAAIKPTLDARRAEKQPHRHRFQIEVANTRRGKAGRQVADYACDCGQIKKEIPVR